MTTIVTADWHLNDLDRDRYRHDWQPRLRSIIKKARADVCLVLGDLTEEKDYHSGDLVNQVVEHLYQLNRLCKVIVMKGNHDYTNPDQPFFAFVNRLPDVRWINTPTKMNDWLFLPHTNNYVRDWHGVPLKAGWIFAHNTFTGAIGDNGRKLEGIPTDIFPRGARVISGDIHSPQSVGPVKYVGAPYTVDFGDNYQPRVLMLDGTRSVGITCYGAQKRLIEIASLKQLEAHAHHINKGDLLKVRIGIKSGDYAKWGSIQDKVREWAAKNHFQLIMVQAVVEAESRPQKQKKRDLRSDKELLLAYAKQRAIDEKTLSTGKFIMEKV